MTPRFDGPVAASEVPRLTRQHERIRDYMLGHGGWRSLSQIAAATGDKEASISAQIRHLRKARFGAYVVEKKRGNERGLWLYRVRPPRLLTLPVEDGAPGAEPAERRDRATNTCAPRNRAGLQAEDVTAGETALCSLSASGARDPERPGRGATSPRPAPIDRAPEQPDLFDLARYE